MKDELNVLQGHPDFALSLFCSVTNHNLPVLFESCILYLLACSEHRYTLCSDPANKTCVQRAHNGPSAGCTGDR